MANGHFEQGRWIPDKPCQEEVYDDKHIEMFITGLNRTQRDYYCEVGGKPDLLIIHPHDARFLGDVERYLWSRYHQNAPIGFGVRSLMGMSIQFSEILARKGVMIMAGNETIKIMIEKFVGKTKTPFIYIHGIALELDIRKTIIGEFARKAHK